jgi:hypothetical protein
VTKKLIITAVFMAAFGPITTMFAMDNSSVPKEEIKEDPAAVAAVAAMTPEEIAEHNRLVEFMRPRVAPVDEHLPSPLVNIVFEYVMPTPKEIRDANTNLLKAAESARCICVAGSTDLEEAILALNAGANIQVIDDHGYTPLHLSARSLTYYSSICYPYFNKFYYPSNNRMIKMLLANKADVNAVNKLEGGHTPLLLVGSLLNNVEGVRILLDAGAEIDARNNNKETALYKAVFKGHGSIVKLLLDRNANPDAANEGRYVRLYGINESVAPLCWAVNQSRSDLVKMLVLAGANPDRASYGFFNTYQITPFEQAKQDRKGYLQETMREMQQVKRTLDGCDALPKVLKGQLELPLIDILYDYALPCDQSEEVQAEIKRRKDIRLQKSTCR